MTQLSFVKSGDTWRASLPKGTGDAVTVQLKREQNGFVRILGNLEGFNPEEIAKVGCIKAGFFKKIECPVGVVITIESETPVILGGYE